MVSTSTYERTNVTPWPTSQWMIWVARARHVLHRVLALDLAHESDRVLEEVSRVLAGAIGGEGLVEMDVGLDEGRRGELPGGVDLAGGGAGRGGRSNPWAQVRVCGLSKG
jgi:hypothetical protein